MSAGATYGGYSLLSRLNTGGMAEVFLAKSRGSSSSHSLLALKRILPHCSEDSNFLSMFQDEARIASGLHHPNICEIYDLGEHGGQLYIVMEYVHGKDLHVIRQRAQRRKEAVPAQVCAYVVAQIANALDYAHHKTTATGTPDGIVHRDVSPSNILVGYDGIPKLIDFGIAKAEFRAAQTQAGRIKGKYAYMSPEQARGEPLDGRSDIFSLGIVLYELLTGSQPFPGSNRFAILQRVARGDYVPVEHHGDTVPADLRAIVHRCLALDRQRRYGRAARLANDLINYLRLSGGPMGEEELSRYVRRLFRQDHAADHQRIEALLAGSATPLPTGQGEQADLDLTRIISTPYLAPGYDNPSAALTTTPSSCETDLHPSSPELLAAHPAASPVAYAVEVPVPTRHNASPHVLAQIAPSEANTEPDATPLPRAALYQPQTSGVHGNLSSSAPHTPAPGQSTQRTDAPSSRSSGAQRKTRASPPQPTPEPMHDAEPTAPRNGSSAANEQAKAARTSQHPRPHTVAAALLAALCAGLALLAAAIWR